MADIDEILSRYARPADSPQSDIADIASQYSGSGWDRDMVLPFAREVGGRQVSADPQAWRDSSDIMRHIDQREGKQWKFATPQIGYDALEAAINVGSAPFAGGYKMDDESRHRMIDMAGAIVGPQAGIGIGRAATLGTEAGLGSHGGRLPASQPARSIDPLGYYSQAYEAAKALPQAKGTPEQMLAMLRKGGAKDAELAAANLDAILSGKPSVTRDEILKHLEENRTGLNEVKYGEPDPNRYAKNAGFASAEEMSKARGMSVDDLMREATEMFGPPQTKWANYSLDPTNPTYRETVLHLPEARRAQEIEARMKENQRVIYDISEQAKDLRANPDFAPLRAARSENAALLDELKQINAGKFQSGHFPEPNIIGHMMTSTTSHNGKPVYTIDQIQSDWGQRLRDKGVRDEGKIKELQQQHAEAKQAADKAYEDADAWMRPHIDPDPSRMGYASEDGRMLVRSDLAHLERKPELRDQVQDWFNRLDEVRRAQDLLRAEMRTAESATPGHPLVNNTDQWTNTTLRRALTQAANSNAEYLAIPSGKTVLGYNPGDLHGMTEFYDKIVPKNLRNILQKLDKEYPPVQSVPTLDSPSGKTGLGKGFSLFPLPDHIKEKIKQEGLPLFARGIGPQPLRPYQDEQ